LDLLKRIEGLTPGRQFYPVHMQVMQRVHWDANLPFTSQSAEFHVAVDRLFDIARRMKLLQSEDAYVDPPELASVNACLLRRDMIRTSVYQVDGFGAEHYTHGFDRDYDARAGVSDPQRGSQCSVAAQMILRNQPALHSSIHANELLDSVRKKHLHNATVHGRNSQLEPDMLRYDARWLEKPASFLPTRWCNLHSLLTTSPQKFNKFDLMIWLSTIAFAESTDLTVVQVLAAFYNCPDLALVQIPTAATFELKEGASPTLAEVEELVKICRPFHTCPEASLPKLANESGHQWNVRRDKQYRWNNSQAAKAFAREIHSQWPTAEPTTPRIQSAQTYLNTETAMSNVRRMFEKWHDNLLFYQYLEAISRVTARQSVVCAMIKHHYVVNIQDDPTKICGSSFYGISDIFNLETPTFPAACKSSLKPMLLAPNRTTIHQSTAMDFTQLSACIRYANMCAAIRAHDLYLPVPPAILQIPIEQLDIKEDNTKSKTRLNILCEKLNKGAGSSREEEYIEDLRHSCNSLGLQEEKCRVRTDALNVVDTLETYLEGCRRYLREMNAILRSLAFTGDGIAAHTIQCPRISPIFWLRQLNRDRFNSLDQGWKEVVISYGLAVTELHRARRLMALSSNPIELAEELRNHGHQNWSPLEFPETLLLEAENGLLVREVQEEIAKQMRCPPDDKNSVMQLNMGEGKSSVIVPIIASYLAQGEL
jgi:hypothetical protein